MSTATNKLPDSFIVHNPQINIKAWSIPSIDLSPTISPEIRFQAHKPGRTPSLRKSNALRLISLLKDSEIAGWHLKSILLVRIYPRRKQSSATTWLEGVVEYGVGKEDNEAIVDLVTSLGEYWEALEKREANLGDEPRKELDSLRNLIRRAK